MRFPVGLSAKLTGYIIKKRLARETYTPLVLMLEPLFACNLKCATCGRIREYRDRASETMSLDECIASAVECGAPVVAVCGGEPLIYPEIVGLVEALTGMGRYVYLCTNGVKLLESIDSLRPSGRLLINVHLDGPAEVHDALVCKNGAFESAVNGIVVAAKRGFQVTVNTTVCKQTNMNQLDAMMSVLGNLGVSCFMLSPAYSYQAVDSRDWFMSRTDIKEKFKNIDQLAQRHRLADSPIYLEYLKGERELKCTAWGNPTRNPAGWRSPCYLLADRHYPTYKELISNTHWNSYGADNDPRCRDCMVHCGFEPTAALMIDKRPGDFWKMVKWQFG